MTASVDCDAPSAARPRWQPGDRQQLAVVAFSHTIQHSYVAVLGIVYPFALVAFHTSYAVLGVILGVAGVTGGLLQGVAGWVKKVSSRTLLGAQNVGMALVSGLGAVSPNIAVFGLARVLGNLTSWPQHPVGSAHLTERIPHRRGLALAVHTTGGNVGTLLAPLAASAVVASFGWRWALAGAGLVMALASVVTWTGVKERRPQGGADPAPASGVGGSPASGVGGSAASGLGGPPADGATVPPAGGVAPSVAAAGVAPGGADLPPSASLRTALRRRPAVAVLVAGMISGAGRGLGVLTTYVPAYLRSGLHQSAITVGVLTTVVSAGALFGPIAGGHLSDRFGRRPVLYILYACGAVSLASFVMVGASGWALAAAGLAVGVFAYSEQPIRQALFSDALSDVSARQAFGAYFAISQSAGAAWVTVLGVLITTSGFKAAFFTMAASFVAAGLVIAFGCRRPTEGAMNR